MTGLTKNRLDPSVTAGSSTELTPTKILTGLSSPRKRNTGLAAIKMPEHIGEVYPFRYAEIENAGGIDSSTIRQVCVHYPFDDRHPPSTRRIQY